MKISLPFSREILALHDKNQVTLAQHKNVATLLTGKLKFGQLWRKNISVHFLPLKTGKCLEDNTHTLTEKFFCCGGANALRIKEDKDWPERSTNDWHTFTANIPIILSLTSFLSSPHTLLTTGKNSIKSLEIFPFISKLFYNSPVPNIRQRNDLERETNRTGNLIIIRVDLSSGFDWYKYIIQLFFYLSVIENIILSLPSYPISVPWSCLREII